MKMHKSTHFSDHANSESNGERGSFDLFDLANGWDSLAAMKGSPANAGQEGSILDQLRRHSEGPMMTALQSGVSDSLRQSIDRELQHERSITDALDPLSKHFSSIGSHLARESLMAGDVAPQEAEHDHIERLAAGRNRQALDEILESANPFKSLLGQYTDSLPNKPSTPTAPLFPQEDQSPHISLPPFGDWHAENHREIAAKEKARDIRQENIEGALSDLLKVSAEAYSNQASSGRRQTTLTWVVVVISVSALAISIFSSFFEPEEARGVFSSVVASAWSLITSWLSS